MSVDYRYITNEISYIAIDNEDNKWCSTSGKVTKFNNISWLNYDSANSNSCLTSNRYVKSIITDRYGNKWFSTSDGAVYYNGVEWKLFNLENSGLVNREVYAVAIDCHRALQSVPLVGTSKCTTPLN